MRSLFLKIFISFWIAQALSVMFAILLTTAFHPKDESATWEALRTHVLSGAMLAYENGGAPAARQYLEDVERMHEVRAFLFDDTGTEVSGRPVPRWAEHLATGHPLEHRGLDHRAMMPGMPERFVAQKGTAPSGRQYMLSMEMPRGPRALLGPHGVPGLGIGLGILSSGLVCYLLARYLTAPVGRLREATQQLAAGDLSARAGGSTLRRHDEIADLVRDFDGMAERIENLVNAQNRLLHDISHELRSPLARLSVALGLARQRTGKEAESVLDRIENETSRLNELIGRLLTLARLEGGEEAMPQSGLRLDQLVAEVGKDAEFEAQVRNCHVKVRTEAECTLTGNAALLRSAIENVVRNAVRHTREGSDVQMLLQQQQAGFNAEAVIRISDSGPGVPETSLDKLFRPFYRLEDDRGRQTGGVGLGLSIAERAIRLHGGSVKAMNRPEGGLTVEIRLPLAARAAADAGNAVRS